MKNFVFQTKEMKSAKAAIELLRPNVCAMAVLGLAIAATVFGIDVISFRFAIAAAAALKSGAPILIYKTFSGTRPILVELQSLVTPTSFGNPRRTAVGYDYNRIVLLSAILQKRAGFSPDSE